MGDCITYNNNMLNLLIQLATPISVLIGGVLLAINNYWKNNNTIDDRLIKNYKALDEQQKEQLALKESAIFKYQNDIAEIKATMATLKEQFAKEVGKLQGQIDAKNTELASLRATILDPNLNLGLILHEIRDFMKTLTASNLHQTAILDKQVKDEADIAHRDRNLESGRDK